MRKVLPPGGFSAQRTREGAEVGKVVIISCCRLGKSRGMVLYSALLFPVCRSGFVVHHGSAMARSGAQRRAAVSSCAMVLPWLPRSLLTFCNCCFLPSAGLALCIRCVIATLAQQTCLSPSACVWCSMASIQTALRDPWPRLLREQFLPDVVSVVFS